MGTTLETITMGTYSDCDVIIHNDPYISPRHCRITRVVYPGHPPDVWQLIVEDLGSMNGTFVNGHEINTPTELLIGDRLRIGRREAEIPPHAFWREP